MRRSGAGVRTCIRVREAVRLLCLKHSGTLAWHGAGCPGRAILPRYPGLPAIPPVRTPEQGEGLDKARVVSEPRLPAGVFVMDRGHTFSSFSWKEGTLPRFPSWPQWLRAAGLYGEERAECSGGRDRAAAPMGTARLGSQSTRGK